MYKYDGIEFEAYDRPYKILQSQKKLYFYGRSNGKWDTRKLFVLDNDTDDKYAYAAYEAMSKYDIDKGEYKEEMTIDRFFNVNV